MKSLIIAAILLISFNAYAGGDIYFGKFIDAKHYRANPDGGKAAYVAGCTSTTSFPCSLRGCGWKRSWTATTATGHFTLPVSAMMWA